MKRLASGRTMLWAAGTLIAVAMVGTVRAQPADVSGMITFEGGVFIPEGEIHIYVEGLALNEGAQQDAARTRVKSDGESRTLDFSILLPTSSAAPSGTRIVARLERADGWLLARGSAQIGIDTPVSVILHTAMY